MVVLVKPISSIFRGQEMGLIGCPEIPSQESCTLNMGPVRCPGMSRVKILFPWIWDQ